MTTDVQEFLAQFENVEDVVAEKLDDAMNAPGVPIEFEPHEAELAGAHPDDAVSFDDAQAAAIDIINT